MSQIEKLMSLAGRMKPDKDLQVQKLRVGKIPVLVLRPKDRKEKTPALLWIHGGGYFLGMKEMVYMGRAADLVNRFGITVISPGYRLAFQAPYPAALQDCYRTLIYMKKHARNLGIDEDRIMVGGESAGGGLTAALCMLARDRGTVKITYQFPLYPMLSNLDTESSRNNHGRVWNTKRNHLGWRFYMRGNAKKKVSPYASPIHQQDFRGLPPAYTFVGNGEPFYAETLEYVRKLKEAGVWAEADVYPSDMHAFDMLDRESEVSKQAIRTFEGVFGTVLAAHSEFPGR